MNHKLTLKLFNGVLVDNQAAIEKKPFISREGFIITPNALHLKKEILSYYREELLSGNDLNKTFHKSWKKVLNSTREELAFDQVLHYLTTYGLGLTGDDVYIPEEVFNLPKGSNPVRFKVVQGFTKEELIKKSLDLLRSGIALQEETLDNLLKLLTDQLDYNFTGKENIKNKEALVKLAEVYGVYPESPSEFLRFIVYRTTERSLLIKDRATIVAIKQSSYNPGPLFKSYGLEKLSTVFNRFKPLFLAYKNRCPKTINKISKLSKRNHKPLVQNPLNQVTYRLLREEDRHWLENATIYALFRALSVCFLKTQGQDTFLHKIRNGKSWTRKNTGNASTFIPFKNYQIILDHLKSKVDLTGIKVYIPKNISYALPVSEKLYIGNIPVGTKITGKKLAVGVYWENDWGARDLDLSGINIGGKIGWNSQYKQEKSLIFSGDMTDATNGAVEYLYARNGLNYPTILKNSVFSGNPTCDFKIVVGKGDKVSRDYMMNPKNLIIEEKVTSVERESIVGMFIPERDEKVSYVLLNIGAGTSRVSSYGELSDLSTTALFQQYKDPLSLEKVLVELGAEISENQELVDYDLTPTNLTKDTFINLFKREEVLT